MFNNVTVHLEVGESQLRPVKTTLHAIGIRADHFLSKIGAYPVPGKRTAQLTRRRHVDQTIRMADEPAEVVAVVNQKRNMGGRRFHGRASKSLTETRQHEDIRQPVDVFYF